MRQLNLPVEILTKLQHKASNKNRMGPSLFLVFDAIYRTEERPERGEIFLTHTMTTLNYCPSRRSLGLDRFKF